ncbi:MAG: hypothetical protein ABR589_05690 [Chthoniobacterales bacterium]
MIFVSAAGAANPPETSMNPSSGEKMWVGTAPGGASAGEGSCVDTVNCDVFKITVLGEKSDWENDLIALHFAWNLGSNDYDFYIHRDAVDGPITSTGRNGGSPETTDDAAIDPAATGVGDYFVHVVYFAAVGVDQYRGTAKVESKITAERTATYTKSNAKFSPNIALKAPVAGRDG